MDLDDQRLRVCYFGTFRDNYSRNQIMIEGLRRNGVEVLECHARLWQGVEDRVQAASGGWLRPAFVARVLRAYGGLLRAYRQVADEAEKHECCYREAAYRVAIERVVQALTRRGVQ